ncbi:MAG TPA: RecX family transcriptional regulator [Stellaceae bacterium]|nr:RecX family transcriptional regulator [Stellaceae bacterium]
MAQRKRAPRGGEAAPLDEAALKDAAIAYLAHFASSSENLRRVLMRRVARAAGDARIDAATGARFVDAVVARMISARLLDDGAYAAQQAASLHRRGVSAAGIRFRLREKGVDDAHVRAALAELGVPAASELEAACALARRRRLGPFRPAASRAAAHDRDLGVLARAGFGFDVARRVLAARDEAALDRLAREKPD